MLDKKLEDYKELNIYPFHMPGHKRNFQGPGIDMDITEIDGFDDLHHSQGILKEAQERAARLYGADKTYYLVNGSTCGILAAISGATQKGDKVIVARNCHKAVYNAVYLRELIPTYIYPVSTKFGIQGQISIEAVKKAIADNREAKAIIITSPTYDGIVSDIRSIAGLAHEADMALIVDEAHGAHFGFDDNFPENAIKLGADAIITSVHKTLPAYTQTALLHLMGDRLDRERIEMFLDIYETSSPSYILMAGIEKCISYVDKYQNTAFHNLWNNLDNFYKGTRQLKNIRVMCPGDLDAQEAYAVDPSKILIFPEKLNMTGYELGKILLEKYKIQLEMTAPNYGLALTSIMDKSEGFERLLRAIVEIDARYQHLSTFYSLLSGKLYRKMTKSMEIHQAINEKSQYIQLEEAGGKISGAYINLYPPGIPIIVPGERIDDRFISDILEAKKMGFDIYGLREDGRIKIVNFS